MSSNTYKFKTKPYAHQVKGIKFAMDHIRNGRAGAAFLFEPRTGKSKTMIDTLSILHRHPDYQLRKVVIIAPNRVLGTWVEEFHVHCPLSVQTIIWDADARKYPLPTSLGPYDLQVVLVNFEAFSTPGKKLPSGRRSKTTGRFKHRAMLRTWIGDDDVACVVDESHKIKSPSGKSSTTIVSMRDDFRYRFILTGTPITKANRAHDAYMQWQFLNPDRFRSWGPTIATFKNHIGRWVDSNGYPQWVGERAEGMEDLKHGIHSDGMVVRREDCFDLPARDTRIIRVKLQKSARHYDEMAQHMVTKLESGEVAEASIPLVVTLRLQQIASGFVGVTPTPPESFAENPEDFLEFFPPEYRNVSKPVRVGTEKLDKLKEILIEEALERDEKIVIAAKFKPDLNAIERLCTSLDIPTWSIRGGLTREETDGHLRAFKRHSGVGAMLIQPQAASLGIDLSTASHMVWFSLTSSWVDYTQACDRIALSRTSTTFTYLIAEGTVDEVVYDALQLDGSVSKEILRKPSALLRKG